MGNMAEPLQSLYLLFYDPAEADPDTTHPGLLRGVYASEASARDAIGASENAEDARWVVAKYRLDQAFWTAGFVTAFGDSTEGSEPNADEPAWPNASRD